MLRARCATRVLPAATADMRAGTSPGITTVTRGAGALVAGI
jgi:hypothetical protein